VEIFKEENQLQLKDSYSAVWRVVVFDFGVEAFFNDCFGYSREDKSPNAGNISKDVKHPLII
jgi:hypothetical protein